MQYYFLGPLLRCFYTISKALKKNDQHHVSLPQDTIQSSARVVETEQLSQKIQVMIEMLSSDRIALRERVAEVHRLAYTDPLTNLPNRASLEEWFKMELKS